MGTTCSSIQNDYKIYKKHPRLIEEFKCGTSFLRNLFRLEFQFYADFEEVWKIQNKANYAIYSLHERKKSGLAEHKTCYNFITRENRIITNLSNNFIQKVHYTFQEETALYLVTEYIYGRLSYYVNHNYEFSEKELQYIAASLILGLEYLESKNVLHRNLRPENIYFNQYGKVKIGGFLYAREGDYTANSAFDCVGAVGYMAPEVIEKKPHSRNVDLYGLGIVLYEAAKSERLFSSTDNQENLKRMTSLKLTKKDLPQRYSENLVNLLNLLLKYNPEERLGICFGELKSHPWFRDFDWEALANDRMKPMFVPEYEEKETLNTGKKKVDYKLIRRPSMQSLFVGFQHGLDLKETIEEKDISGDVV